MLALIHLPPRPMSVKKINFLIRSFEKMLTYQKLLVHFFCLIKRNEPKKNQVRLKASTFGRRSKKQPIAPSPKASLFVRYAAKRTIKNTINQFIIIITV
jgi:hypothetical protein